MANLYAIHDQEGAHLVPDGGWCVALVKLLNQPPGTDYGLIRRNINWLVRLNWGYGSEGTIAHLHNLRDYRSALVKFVTGSVGVHGYIIGNEPNHENERPSGLHITPEHYAEFYCEAYEFIKSYNPNLRCIVAAPAPYHANGYTWIEYYQEMLAAIASQGVNPDGFAIHAYTRSQQRDAIHSVEKMGGRLDDTFAGFFTYRDALNCIPRTWHHLPAYLTEFNPIPGWQDENTGIVKRFYQEIDWWNNQNGSQKILCGALYRYPGYDEGAKWAFGNKPGVIADFREAVQLNLQAPTLQSPQNPTEGPGTTKEVILMPSIKVPPTNAPGGSVTFQREINWDVMKQRGMALVEVQESPAWKVKRVQWLDEGESQGRHHILIDTLDEKGNRITGVNLKVMWPTGSHTITSEEKRGEPYSTNYPMSGSLNEFSVMVSDSDIPTEMVRGIGMGKDGNKNIHTSTVVVFQKVGKLVQHETPPSENQTEKTIIL